MGLSLEFYAGDALAIGEAFTNFELDGLRDGTIAHAYADFSLHLRVEDMDTLSEQAALLMRHRPLRLLDCLESTIGGVAGETGADLVSNTWVKLMASIPKDSAAQLSKLWLEAANAQNQETISTDSPDAVEAVASLLALCQEAVRRKTDVVFAWYL